MRRLGHLGIDLVTSGAACDLLPLNMLSRRSQQPVSKQAARLARAGRSWQQQRAWMTTGCPAGRGAAIAAPGRGCGGLEGHEGLARPRVHAADSARLRLAAARE